MSRQHIATYRRTLAEQHRVTGSLNERVVRKAFADLLERTGRPHDLVFTNEWEGRGPRGNNIAVDGALVPSILRKPFGYWEAKDQTTTWRRKSLTPCLLQIGKERLQNIFQME